MSTQPPGPAAMANFDQDRAQAIELLRNATHGFVVSTAFIDEDGDKSYSYLAQINPNDRNRMTIGWCAEWYRNIHDRTYRVFASVIRGGIEEKTRFENEEDE